MNLLRFEWRELTDALIRHPLRTALTAVSVGWGVFMLMVLLGLGQGLENGMRRQFADEAQNSIWIRGAKTSLPHAGFDVGRRITFENRDYDMLRNIAGIDSASGRFFLRDGTFGGGDLTVRYGTKANTFAVEGVHPDAQTLNAYHMVAGRFLQASDASARRKVAVIGRPVAEFFFGPTHGAALGQWLIVGRVPFMVVGVFGTNTGPDQERAIYVPVATAQTAFAGGERLNGIMFTVGQADPETAKPIVDRVVGELARAHAFDPNDKQALRVQNNVENHARFAALFRMIAIFVVAIGVGTVAAGVVGVSNIMMISVKERTKEIGIRKALGATPASIISMIVVEAIMLTTLAGLAGLALGMGVLALSDAALAAKPDSFLQEPRVNLAAGLWATVGLAFFGALAGYFPARAAARVNPVVSLRDQ